MSATIYFIFEVLLLYFVPLFTLASAPELLRYRHSLFVLGGIYLIFRARTAHVKPSDWGLTKTGFTGGWVALLTSTLILPVLVYLLLQYSSPALRPWLIGYDLLNVSLPLRLFLYSFGSVPIQEFIFRSYLTWRIEKLGYSRALNILLATALFVIGHLPYRSPIMLGVSLVIGYLYSSIYLRYRNLYSLILAHALVGSILILVINQYLPY